MSAARAAPSGPTPGGAAPPAGPASRGSSRAVTLAVAAGLAAATVAAFWPAVRFQFVGYDDGLYVTDNPIVQGGLTWRGVAWAFTSLHAANWHPLTWLSHMVDVQLFGLDPGLHHLVNVALHAANAALLFGWLAAATGERARSALVAALFALHPLHVESVAWIAERKDLLSTATWILTLWAYLRYVRRPGVATYLPVVLVYALALASKPMVVTLPVVLLLLDAWPLGRLPGRPWSARRLWPLLAEKLPLLGMALACSAATLVAQAPEALESVRGLPVPVRIENAIVAYAAYLRSTVWPQGLAVIYPHPAFRPGGIPASDVVVASAALAGLAALAVWQRRRRPFVAVGLLWYAVTLVPVIGLVQVGLQGRADRYTYLPLVGVFIAAAWSLPAPSGRAARATAAAAAIAVLGGCAAASRHQLAFWRDTATLFERALAVTSGSWQAMEILGGEYLRRGRVADAARLFEGALALRPGDAVVWANVAAVLAREGDHAAAAAHLERAVQIAPRELDLWVSLATEYAWLDRPASIRELVDRLARVDPGLARQLEGRLRAPPPPP